ncbi:PKD domain-containing protein [Oscillatoria sp. FACHB-1406]|uniref:PKD domain-containing protein n=1 Tax=Oscillatoria sp. FACHB-1406 TaxID=2692846 RepID=UPI001688E47F|nr:PKD domain-containing protein [Oscillatoria sp. FACHB-1406]MBD2580363.1 PEP-CTERM sorting domain-containing protein [Oscillatoria sp. FACHB-1406]
MNDLWKYSSSLLLGTAALSFALPLSPTRATTLSGYVTTGADMAGMNITVNFFDGTSQSAIWGRTGGVSGGASGNGWSLTQSGNTYGSYGNPWNFNAWYGSGVAALIIDAIPGNTLFDIVPGIYDSRQTPGSAEGWPFQVVGGRGPSRYDYSVPIDISRGDLFGRLSLFWDSAFQGYLGFLADADNGTGWDPVRSRDPVPPPPAPPAPPPPPPVAPTLIGIYPSASVIYEGQGASISLAAVDGNADPLHFYLNGGYIGTAGNTSGTRWQSTNLGPFYDEGVWTYTGQVHDPSGLWSNAATSSITVLNVAPTITQITPDLAIDEGNWFGFGATATDPGIYDQLTYRWDLNQDGVYDNFIGQSGQHTFANQGNYRLNLQVDDGDGGYAYNGFNVNVRNVAPTITQITQDLTIDEGSWFGFGATATDPGIYDQLTYRWDLNQDGVYDNFTGQSGQYTFGNQGNYRLGLQVDDGDGGYAYNGFNVNILNVAPTITQITDNLRLRRKQLFDFSGLATDPGINDLLAFDWDFSGKGLFDDFTGQSGQWSFADKGIHTVTLRVSDGDGGITYRSFTVETVPEPSSALGLLTLGVVGAAARRKRKV